MDGHERLAKKKLINTQKEVMNQANSQERVKVETVNHDRLSTLLHQSRDGAVKFMWRTSHKTPNGSLGPVMIEASGRGGREEGVTSSSCPFSSSVFHDREE